MTPSRERLFKPSLAAWLFVVGLLCAGLAECARAQGNMVQVDCRELAAFVAVMTTYRDVDASLAKVRALFRGNNAAEDRDVLAVFDAEMSRVWVERLPRNEAAAAAFTRCMQMLGQYPRTKSG